MEMPASLPAIARSASILAASAVSVASGTVAFVTAAASSRPISGSRAE